MRDSELHRRPPLLPPQTARGVGLLVAVVVLAWAAGLFFSNGLRSPLPWANHDVSFHVWLGEWMLDGARLYVDVVDDNPPGSPIMLGALAGVARLLGVSPFLAVHLFLLAVGAAGLILLRRAFEDADDATTGLLVGLAYLVVIVRGNFSNNLFEGLFRLPYDFAEREHFFSLLFLPYLVWRLRGGRPRWPVYPYLALVGFVSTFKPYWPLFILAAELVVAARRGWRVAVPAWLFSGMLLPLALLLLHSPASVVAMFADVLPYHLTGAYAYYGSRLSDFWSSGFHAQILAVALPFLALAGLALRRGLAARTSPLLWTGLAAAAYLSVLHQHKFWSYHAMVLFGLLVVGGALLWGELARSLLNERVGRALVVVVLAGQVALCGITLEGLQTMLEGLRPRGHELVPLLRNREDAMFFSVSVDHSYGPVVARTPSVGPWSVHHRLPALVALEDPVLREAALAEYAGRVEARIAATRPELLVFAPYEQALPAGQTLHGFFDQRGVVPRAGYARLSPARLAAYHPRLVDWIVYEREATD